MVAFLTVGGPLSLLINPSACEKTSSGPDQGPATTRTVYLEGTGPRISLISSSQRVIVKRLCLGRSIAPAFAHPSPHRASFVRKPGPAGIVGGYAPDFAPSLEFFLPDIALAPHGSPGPRRRRAQLPWNITRDERDLRGEQ